MKNKKILLSIVALILVCFTLSSCMLFPFDFPGFTSQSSDTNTSTNSNLQTDNDLSPDTPIEGVSLSSAYINENGELILVYTNGQTQNLGVVVGSDGKDGVASGSIDVNITGNGADVGLAVSKAIRSAVSVSCAFTTGSLFNSSTSYSSGSGVIYKLDKTTGDAFIITNFHVVYDEDSTSANGISNDIKVFLYGAEYTDYAIPATYVGGSINYDIAVLRVEDSKLLKDAAYCAATIGNSSKVYVGDNAIAIGNPEGEGISATSGIVSVDSERIVVNIGTDVELRVIRIDAPINPGNSGGGLFNKNGELIGIVNAKTTGSDNIGYAIPSNVAVGVAQNIIDHCFGTSLDGVQRPLMGITITTSTSKLVYNEDGRVEIQEAVIVDSVNAGSIADGKIKKGDIIKKIRIGDNELTVTRQFHIIDFMLNARVGDVVYTTVDRGGTEVIVEITITQGCIANS